MKSFFLRFLSIALVLFVLPFAGKGKTEPYDVKDPDACVLNFSILSDSHIEGNNFARYKIFNNALQNVTQNQSGNDAIVFLGDNTMNGQHIENMLFHGTAAMMLRGETVEVGIDIKPTDCSNKRLDVKVDNACVKASVSGTKLTVVAEQAGETYITLTAENGLMVRLAVEVKEKETEPVETEPVPEPTPAPASEEQPTEE